MIDIPRTPCLPARGRLLRYTKHATSQPGDIHLKKTENDATKKALCANAMLKKYACQYLLNKYAELPRNAKTPMMETWKRHQFYLS
jgi:hypothetical protein